MHPIVVEVCLMGAAWTVVALAISVSALLADANAKFVKALVSLVMVWPALGIVARALHLAMGEP